MRSVISHLGSDFWRIRIGVGHPGERGQVRNHVLRRAPTSEEEMILAAIGDAIAVLPVLITDGGERAMTQLHTRREDGD